MVLHEQLDVYFNTLINRQLCIVSSFLPFCTCDVCPVAAMLGLWGVVIG